LQTQLFLSLVATYLVKLNECREQRRHRADEEGFQPTPAAETARRCICVHYVATSLICLGFFKHPRQYAMTKILPPFMSKMAKHDLNWLVVWLVSAPRFPSGFRTTFQRHYISKKEIRGNCEDSFLNATFH
jgi:hypothetical protein